MPYPDLLGDGAPKRRTKMKKPMSSSEKVRILTKVLKYYANPRTWARDDMGNPCALYDDFSMARLIETYNDGSAIVLTEEFAGNRARSALKKCGIKTPKRWEPK